MSGSTFNVTMTELRRQLLIGLERSCYGRRVQRVETIAVKKMMSRLRCSAPWNYRERNKSTDRGWNKETVLTSVEGVV
jgi:hypothetical protein